MFKIFHSLFSIDYREVEFSRRGFSCTRSAVRERLELAGSRFLDGYHSALKQPDPEALAGRLDQISPEQRGFAYEGAAMGLTLLDGLTPWNNYKRFLRFVEGPGQRYIYMLYVGAGWACARLPWLRHRLESVVASFHPVLGSLTIDGYGFHEGYFHWENSLQPKISALSEGARHIFYQGLGRSLWFVKGADAYAIARTISAFPPQFHGDAWSGVGLGCAYAGGLDRAGLQQVLGHAGEHAADLAQGVAFAAKARELAGNSASHTELACALLCGMNAEEAAALCDQTLAQTAGAGSPAYQEWRNLLQKATAEKLQATRRRPLFSRIERHAAS